MKIAIVHNQCMEYRYFLFSALAQNFDIDFYFFNESPNNIPPQCSATILKGFHIPKFSDYWVVPCLEAVLSQKKYDLMIGSDLGAYITAIAFKVAQKQRIPFIPWILEWNWITHFRRKWRINFENHLLQKASSIITPGSRHLHYLQNRGVNPDKVKIVPNCLPEKSIQINELSPLYQQLSSLKQKYQLIVSIGRHVDFKGHEQLIRAQHILEQEEKESSYLIIAGNGPLLKKNKKLAAQLKIKRIKFIDNFVNGAEKHILYHLADIFVLTSTRTNAFEAWGLVCNEAARFGKPIISSDMVGAVDNVIIHQKNGFVFPDRNILALSQYLSSLINNADLRQKFSQASLEIYENFRPEKMIDSFSELIQSYEER